MERDRNLQISEPIKRIFRNPAYLGARLFLAGITAGGFSGCAAGSGSEAKCPATIAEVSLLMGGSPENWKDVDGVKGAWVFKSNIPQNLGFHKPGRLGIVESANSQFSRETVATHAWYVCPSSIGTSNLTPVPTSAK